MTYCALDVFDNATSNFSSVFLNEAYPFLFAALERRQNVLVHCKSGLSKSPAVVAGLLMLRYDLPLLRALELVLESGQRVKISDHLLGELLLLADSKEGAVMSPHALPVDQEAHAEENAELAASIAKMLQEEDFAAVAGAAASHPLLVRRLVLELPPLALTKLEPFCSYLRRFAAAVPRHVYACLRKDPADVGAALADALDALVRADVESDKKDGASVENVVFALDFVRNFESFAARYEELSRRRFLEYFYRGEEEKHTERVVTSELTRIPQLKRLERKLGLMLRDLQTSVKEMGSGGRVLLVPQTVWSTTMDEGVCNIPEALAAFALPALPEGKKLQLQRHLGVVHAKFGSVTIAMPTDVFCVLEVFNHLDSPTRDEIYDMCRSDRLDAILAALLAPVARAKHALLLRLPDGRYEVNPAFESRVRMLEIRL